MNWNYLDKKSGKQKLAAVFPSSSFEEGRELRLALGFIPLPAL